MRKQLLTAIFFGFASLANAQTIKIQAGISNSSLDWAIVKGTVKVYDQSITAHSFFLGVEYLQKKYFNLSSSIGTIRKGGGEGPYTVTDPFGMPLAMGYSKAIMDYLSINTMLDLKYPIKNKLFPFVSVGPRIDYLISSNDVFTSLKNIDEQDKLIYGLNVGGGLKYQFKIVQIGTRTDYLLNFNSIADYHVNTDILERISVKDKTFLVSLFVGFKLK